MSNHTPSGEHLRTVEQSNPTSNNTQRFHSPLPLVVVVVIAQVKRNQTPSVVGSPKNSAT
jgi:hypothetical protein